MNKQIGDFILCFPIADGGSNDVYFAQNKLVPIPVAIKILPKDGTNTIRRLKIQNEISIMRNMDHPNIISLFDTYEDEDNVYLVLEYADNGSFLNFIHPGKPMKEEQIKTYFSQIFDALYYMHCVEKVVHRDIKAENILLDSNFHIKISDFGLSHSYQHDILKTQCGSPNYLAPEIINNQLYGPPVDIWSAGVLLFLASTGNFPFIGDNMPKLFRKILSEKVGFPDFLSLELRDLLEKMLEKNPQDRITIEQILSHKWLSNQIPKKSVSLPSLSGNITKQDMISAVSLELEKYGFDAEEVAGKLHIKDKEYLMIASILTKRIESQQRAKNANRNAKKIPMMGKSHVVSGLINKGNIYSLENNPSIKANASNAKANLIFDAQFNQTNAQNTQNHPNTFDQENRQSLQNNPNTFDQENRQNGITNTVINSDVVQPSVTSPGNKNLASTGCLPNESFHHGSRLSTICKKSQSSFGINLDRNQLSLVQRNIRSKNYRHLINKHISMDFLHLQPNGNQTNTFLETPNQDDSQNFNNIPEDETIMNNANDGKDNSNKATSGEKVRIITQTEEVPKMVISEGAGSRLLKFGIIRERHKSNNV